MTYNYQKSIVYEVEITINEEIYRGFMELNPIRSLEIDLPTIEGFGRYSGSKEVVEAFGRNDAKHNPRHHSTRCRITHREGRLAKLSQR